ncbi:MAG: hypothetical protein JNK89_08290 [Saprospiraceae bacterium]|nr:hypothetical protein [Saprospiraceae bacterium]
MKHSLKFPVLLGLLAALFITSCRTDEIPNLGPAKDLKGVKEFKPTSEQLASWPSTDAAMPSLQEELSRLSKQPAVAPAVSSRTTCSVTNNGFEDGSSGWTYSASGYGINFDPSLAWIFGSSDPYNAFYFSFAYHPEDLAHSGDNGASAVENGPTNHILQQTITLPELECGEQTLNLNFWMRWKNYYGGWIPEYQDIIVAINEDILLSASSSGFASFSGGGDPSEAFYESFSLDVSAYEGQTVTLSFFNRVCCYYQFLDIDDICVTAEGVCDTDGDGCNDNEDPHPNSIQTPTVVIDGCNSNVPNLFVTSCSTMSDLIADCAASAGNHGQFVSCVTQLANGWKQAGLITGAQKGAIVSCAAQSNIPN